MIRICKYCNKEFSVTSKYSNKKHCNYVCRFKSLMPNVFNDDCVEWPLSCNPVTGYGQISTKDEPGGSLATHRISYEIYNGAIPDLLLVRHTCDNRKCVNPKHLILGTQKDNMTDMWSKNRQQKYLNQPKAAENGAVKYPERLSRGEKHHSSKLNETTVRELRLSKESHAELGRKYLVTPEAIAAIRKYKSWKHVI